ncbi:hypothetical protein AC482_05290 [miscellaneous Crenarchaeota group-15 archaeon DG-45]|uniref:TRAM domain-containing protein n=1 Tax=miscellaneous Crenarchaeota group-15 archaeon DG-45 TaxID=1685127 RepID=A0A0M0BNI1_9ARCH|nr:MAG: hypothetical protein AC482_05290 [miscellaneous Crenarchaeota group-15 archaeon DG-45]
MYEKAESEEVSLGDEFTVLVIRGKGDSIISRMKDGRVILFNRESPIFEDLRPGMIVHGRVIFVAQNYIIMDPVSPPESGVEAIRMGLRMVTESESWEMGIIANALLYMLDLLEEGEA